MESFLRKSAILDRHCAYIGRDPQSITRSTQVRINADDLQEARGRLESYIHAGMTHLILSLPAPYPDGIVYRLDEEIIQPLKAEFAA
jgi:hypothetical protein